MFLTWYYQWTDDASAPPATTPVAPSVGKGRPHRPRTLHFVTIDGVDYEVSSQKEAERILLEIRAKAKAKIAKAVSEKKPEPKPIVVAQKLPPRPDSFTHELQAKIDATNASIRAMYAAEKIAADRIAAFEAADAQDMQDLQDLIDKGFL